MDVLTMGKYGAYVWTSFGLTLAVVVTCILQARRRHRAVLRDIAKRIQLTETAE